MLFTDGLSYEDKHKNICDFIHNDLWIPKNKNYGNSFHELYKELGIISAVTQIVHKCNRLKTLAKIKECRKDILFAKDDTYESMRDTLLDMANYCIMTVMELDKENEDKESEEDEGN